jgi:hypothetical protein
MKRLCLAVVLLVVAYFAIYIVGAPLSVHSRMVSRAWGMAYYPVRLFELRHAPVIHETGTIYQSVEGHWGLTYPKPREDPREHFRVDGIGFRVPSRLADAVSAANRKLAAVTIGQEPDSDCVYCQTYVLTSITPLN